MNLQNIALSGIVGGIVLAFLLVIVAGIIGRPTDEATRLYVFGLFTGLAGSAATWLAANKANSAATDATKSANAEMFSRQRNEIETLKAQVGK